jgi:hypothetical protein
MSHEKDQPADPRHVNEQRIVDLSRMRGGNESSHESRLDNADASYPLAHSAGIMRDETGREEEFEFPSVKRARLQREAESFADRPAVITTDTISHSELSDKERREAHNALSKPEVALTGFDGPVAILEEIADNDALQGSSTITWLGPASREDAQAYLDSVGTYFARPGPGEDDGVYTSRRIIENPHYKPSE